MLRHSHPGPSDVAHSLQWLAAILPLGFKSFAAPPPMSTHTAFLVLTTAKADTCPSSHYQAANFKFYDWDDFPQGPDTLHKATSWMLYSQLCWNAGMFPHGCNLQCLLTFFLQTVPLFNSLTMRLLGISLASFSSGGFNYFLKYSTSQEHRPANLLSYNYPPCFLLLR